MNQRPQTLSQVVTIACLFEQVFNEQFELLKMEKRKTIASGNNNRRNVTIRPHTAQKNGQNNNSNH